MIKKIRKILTSRLFWVSMFVLFEIALILFFVFVIIDAFDSAFNLSNIATFGILLGIYYFIAVVVSIYIVNSKSVSAYKLTWLFFVAILPFVGVFLYLLFGNKKITNIQKRRTKNIQNVLNSFDIDENITSFLKKENLDALHMANYIAKASGSSMYKNSSVDYFKSGKEVFPIILEELEKAKEFIFIEFFIIKPGIFWDSVLEILLRKVKEGVKVKLIYDDVGSIGFLPYNYDKKLTQLGIETIAFHKFVPLLDVKINNRDHRKIIVVDGQVAFSGGFNLSDEYIDEIRRFGYWKDNAIKIKGDAVAGFSILFLSNWLDLKKVDLHVKDFKKEYSQFFPKANKEISDGLIQPYSDIPYNDDSVGEQVYLNLINRAHKYIYITTPYLLIDDLITTALINAVKEGIDVRIITPHIPDKKLVFGITRSYYNILLKNGVKIYEFIPGFIHMKLFVVDDIYATVGTINLDYRSLYLHFENGTFMYKAKAIEDMKIDFLQSMRASKEITYKDYKEYAAPRRLIWAVLRLFAPVF